MSITNITKQTNRKLNFFFFHYIFSRDYRMLPKGLRDSKRSPYIQFKDFMQHISVNVDLRSLRASIKYNN